MILLSMATFAWLQGNLYVLNILYVQYVNFIALGIQSEKFERFFEGLLAKLVKLCFNDKE